MPARKLTRARRARLVVSLVAALSLSATPSYADELEDLRRENTRLRAEVERLRGELAARDRVIETDEAAGAGVERVLVPSRVSLDVQRDEASGVTTITSAWYRTIETDGLPRKEWFQLGARRAAAGTVHGPWVSVERQGGAGTLKVDSGSLTVDGRSFACATVAYESSKRDLTVARGGTNVRNERLRCELPADAIPAAVGARHARFTAGAVDFELTDEHLAAFAAVGARLQSTPQPASTR
jgi:hypothetical protein